ncbi:MAG: sigma-70 family RNA polymerase sigma factor [Patescibacteria group bacterium]
MLDGENKIVMNAIRGEASAFGLLYDHYQPKIYRFILIKVGRREEAEDLTHQVFLSAWQNIEDYEDLGYPFGSWLYQMARNQVIDHYRTRRPTLNIEEVDPDNLTYDSQSAAQAEERLEMEKVKRAILKLKPAHQDVIIMRFVEEMSVKEVAAALHKTEGAVKLLRHRALIQLRKSLGIQNESHSDELDSTN